jgi:hypothetical protein
MDMNIENRRQHIREGRDVACKLFHTPSRRYFPALLRDVGAGGVMIETLWPVNMNPGDEFLVYLRKAGEGIMKHEDGVLGTAVHVFSRLGLTRAGIRFAREQPQWKDFGAGEGEASSQDKLAA